MLLHVGLRASVRSADCAGCGCFLFLTEIVRTGADSAWRPGAAERSETATSSRQHGLTFPPACRLQAEHLYQTPSQPQGGIDKRQDGAQEEESQPPLKNRFGNGKSSHPVSNRLEPAGKPNC